MTVVCIYRTGTEVVMYCIVYRGSVVLCHINRTGTVVSRGLVLGQ